MSPRFQTTWSGSDRVARLACCRRAHAGCTLVDRPMRRLRPSSARPETTCSLAAWPRADRKTCPWTCAFGLVRASARWSPSHRRRCPRSGSRLRLWPSPPTLPSTTLPRRRGAPRRARQRAGRWRRRRLSRLRARECWTGRAAEPPSRSQRRSEWPARAPLRLARPRGARPTTPWRRRDRRLKIVPPSVQNRTLFYAFASPADPRLALPTGA